MKVELWKICRTMSIQEDWVVLDDSERGKIITDIVILAKKEGVPDKYTLIEHTTDHKRADFPEGRLNHTKRYLCYTRHVPSPLRGRVALTDMKVVPAHKTELGFLPLAHTNDDNSKAFSSWQLVVKLKPLEELTRAITDIVILTSAKKEDVPPGFTRLHEINGFSICFKVTNFPKKKVPSQQPAADQHTQPSIPHSAATDQLARQPSIMVKSVVSAIEGLRFKLNDEWDSEKCIAQFALPGNLKLTREDDIEDMYQLDWDEWDRLAKQPIR